MDAEPTNEDDNGQTHAEGTATVAVASADAEEGDEVAVDGPANVEFPGGFVKADAVAFLTKWGVLTNGRGNSTTARLLMRSVFVARYLAEHGTRVHKNSVPKALKEHILALPKEDAHDMEWYKAEAHSTLGNPNKVAKGAFAILQPRKAPAPSAEGISAMVAKVEAWIATAPVAAATRPAGLTSPGPQPKESVLPSVAQFRAYEKANGLRSNCKTLEEHKCMVLNPTPEDYQVARRSPAPAGPLTADALKKKIPKKDISPYVEAFGIAATGDKAAVVGIAIKIATVRRKEADDDASIPGKLRIYIDKIDVLATVDGTRLDALKAELAELKRSQPYAPKRAGRRRPATRVTQAAHTYTAAARFGSTAAVVPTPGTAEAKQRGRPKGKETGASLNPTEIEAKKYAHDTRTFHRAQEKVFEKAATMSMRGGENVQVIVLTSRLTSSGRKSFGIMVQDKLNPFGGAIEDYKSVIQEMLSPGAQGQKPDTVERTRILSPEDVLRRKRARVEVTADDAIMEG